MVKNMLAIKLCLQTMFIYFSGSDSEEELFYYTSKRVAVDDVTRAFTQLHASSPPQKKGTSAKAVADHDYLLKVFINLDNKYSVLPL